MQKKIAIMNGPNLNMLGLRQPEIYGHETLQDVENRCIDLAVELGIKITFQQSNYEGQIVEWIQNGRTEFDAIIINPAAYSHTSVAILDALNAFDGAVIEVHISDIHKREKFRHHSYVTARADHVIMGKGTDGYLIALREIMRLI